MNYLDILNFIKENRIIELTKIEDDPSLFYEDAHRKALKLCINKLKSNWDKSDESYFKMICHHREVISTTFINNLKLAESKNDVARIWNEFVDYVNVAKKSYLKNILD